MKNIESSGRFLQERILPVALSVSSVCSAGAKPFEQMPFSPGQPVQQEQSKLIYADSQPEKTELQRHPLGILLARSTEQDLVRVGLKKDDKTEIFLGLLAHGGKRNYGNTTEIVFYTNTDILDNGFRVWTRQPYLQPRSIFSPRDVQTSIARLLPELTQRFGLPAVTVSSKKSSNCDIQASDFPKGEWKIDSRVGGLHPSFLSKRYESPFGIFENIYEPYAWAKLHDYRDAGAKYKNIPVEVIKEFGIDHLVKKLVHELATHKILGRNHSKVPGDISNETLSSKLRESGDPEAHRKPWSHVYRSKEGREYIANFGDGDPLDDQTNKVIRFLRLARMKEKELKP